MDHSRMDKYRRQRYRNYNSNSEPEYDVVDDLEEMLNVQKLPVRPINDEQAYADKDPRRSSAAHSLSALSTDNVNIPPRKIPLPTGPVINRDLKPGRRKTKFDRRPTPVQPEGQCSQRCSPSPQPFISERVSHMPGLSVHEACRRDGQRRTKKEGFSPRMTGLCSTEDFPAPDENQRHSLDLESHEMETRSHQSLERVPSKRLHHEWPQCKGDQHDFVPMERPPQTYWKEDWYVGACNRADAEHALHLVNKDGAFLVRDCSVNTISEPLVLAVYHEKKVYNVKIRFIESAKKYILGTRQQSTDEFDSVADMIKFHSIFPITLISGRNMPRSRYPENCMLTCPVTKSDVDQLLQ